MIKLKTIVLSLKIKKVYWEKATSCSKFATKVHEEAKRFRIDTVNQAKKASLHTALDAVAMEDNDFSSASVEPSRSSQVTSVKSNVPKWKDIGLKSIFLKKILLFVTLKT